MNPNENKMNLNLLNYTKTDNKMLLVEDINTDKLAYIIDNFDSLNLNLKTKDYDPLTRLKNYLRNCFENSIQVNYSQKQGVARFYARQSLSLQSLPKCIRHTIAVDYIDIDIVNCHFVLLKTLCDIFKISCPHLNNYITDRKKYIDELNGAGCDDAKSFYIFLLYSDDHSSAIKKFKNYEFIHSFSGELSNIQLLLKANMEDRWEEFEKKTTKIKNKLGSFVSFVLQDFENKILMCMYQYLKSPKNCVLCYDGFLIKKKLWSKHLLRRMAKHVNNKFGTEIVLVVKPFDKIIPLPDDIPIYAKGKFNYYFQYSEFITGNTIQKHIVDKWIENCLAFIDQGGKSFIITRNNRFDRITKLESCTFKSIKTVDILKTLNVEFKMMNPNYDPLIEERVLKKMETKDNYKMSKMEEHCCNEIMDMTITEILNSKIKKRDLPNFSGVNFVPYLRRNGKPDMHNEFNSFGGFPLDDDAKIDDNKKFESSKLYSHILTDFCNNDQKECDHLLDHIADMVQQPAKVRGIAHLFFSRQGTGKGLMALFMSKMIGKDHYISYENIDNYFKSFNLDGANKIFKIIEEVAEKGAAFNKCDVLKADITKQRDRIEPKGIDTYFVDHVARYWFFTNNEKALMIENSDRRYTMHRVSNAHMDNKKYFKPIVDEIDSHDFCRNAFEYFACRQYEEENVMTFYKNAFKKEQKILNLSVGIKFIMDIMEHRYKCPDKIETTCDDDIFVKCIDLKDSYRDWCDENGTKYNFNSFKTQLRKLGLWEERKKIDKKVYRVYDMKPYRIQKLFGVFLCDEAFTFE